MKGHERPLTFLKYNREGDLLFSCAKDHNPTVWFADNGERLGVYKGHNGAIWSCDVSRNNLALSLPLSAAMDFYGFGCICGFEKECWDLDIFLAIKLMLGSLFWFLCGFLYVKLWFLMKSSRKMPFLMEKSYEICLVALLA